MPSIRRARDLAHLFGGQRALRRSNRQAERYAPGTFGERRPGILALVFDRFEQRPGERRQFAAQVAHEFPVASHYGEVEGARRVSPDGRVALLFGRGGAHGGEIQIEHGGAALAERGMQFEEAPRHRAAPVDFSRARRVLIRQGGAGAHFGAGHQALGRALHFKQTRGAVAILVIDRRGQMRNLARQTLRLLVDLAADFEDAERVEVFAVLEHVGAQFRQQRHAQQRLVGRDGIGHRDVIGRLHAEGARIGFRHERVVVDFGEALVREDGAHAALEGAFFVGRRHGGEDGGRAAA